MDAANVAQMALCLIINLSALIGRLEVGIDGKEGLQHGQEEQENRGPHGYGHPRVAEIVTHKRRPPPVPPGLHVLADAGHGVDEVVVGREVHLRADPVEEVAAAVVVAAAVHHVDEDAAQVQDPGVLRRADEAVHEDGVGGDVELGARVRLLERDHVPEQRLAVVVELQRRDLQDAAAGVEPDLQEAHCALPLPQPDAGLHQLLGAWYPLRELRRQHVVVVEFLFLDDGVVAAVIIVVPACCCS